MKTLVFDVMLHDRFVCTLKYRHNPAFPIDVEDLVKLVITKRPTLRNKISRFYFKIYAL